MLYMVWMYVSSGPEVADKWLDGYVIELVLSMDTWLLAPGSGVPCTGWCIHCFSRTDGPCTYGLRDVTGTHAHTHTHTCSDVYIYIYTFLYLPLHVYIHILVYLCRDQIHTC